MIKYIYTTRELGYNLVLRFVFFFKQYINMIEAKSHQKNWLINRCARVNASHSIIYTYITHII